VFNITVALTALAVTVAGTAFAVSHYHAAHARTAALAADAPPATPATPGASATPAETAVPIPPHGGVDLNVLLVTDGTPPVEAIRGELTAEGVPVTVIDLRNKHRRRITDGFLARTRPVRGGNFDGIVLPDAAPAGLSAKELALLATYERQFKVREVDAYTPPMAEVGMTNPVYSGPLTGKAKVTGAGAAAGFGYLNREFPFSGGLAGPAQFGYLADPLPGSTPLIDETPDHGSAGTLVWEWAGGGRERLGFGFGYGSFSLQFDYLAYGITMWLTRGVITGDYRNYLTFSFDDMFLGNAQWSTIGKCTPGITACPKGTPQTPVSRMTPADVAYAVQWETRNDYTFEFLYNGGASSRFAVNGTDALLQATKPVAGDFYWVNHTYTHAYLGCTQDFSVVPWRCQTAGGQVQWAAGAALIDQQIEGNFTWARQNGIPAEPGVVATGEYSGIRLVPQQQADNPYLVQATRTGHIMWIALDASREPAMRPVGAALGIPRHPIDIGEDAQTVAEEVGEFNWYNDSKSDGGSGICHGSHVTSCLKPLANAGWLSVIVPGQAQIVLAAMLSNDPRPFFMHQSNLTADRLGYPVMDAVLSAYRAVFGPQAPVTDLPMDADGVVLRDQQLWSQESGKVSAWVEGDTLTVAGPPGATVPVTVPAGSRGAEFVNPYAGEKSGFTTLGAHPLTITLPSAPY
jgi:hypothetical protein